MTDNLMGFKKVSKLTPKGRSIYDPLLDEVRKTGGLYALDTQDAKRAYSLANTIKSVVKKRGYVDIKVGVADRTTVYIEKRG